MTVKAFSSRHPLIPKSSTDLEEELEEEEEELEELELESEELELEEEELELEEDEEEESVEDFPAKAEPAKRAEAKIIAEVTFIIN